MFSSTMILLVYYYTTKLVVVRGLTKIHSNMLLTHIPSRNLPLSSYYFEQGNYHARAIKPLPSTIVTINGASQRIKALSGARPARPAIHDAVADAHLMI